MSIMKERGEREKKMRRLLVYFAPPPPPPRVCVLSTCYDEDSRGRGGKRGEVEKLGNAGVASELKKPSQTFPPSSFSRVSCPLLAEATAQAS